MFQKQSDKDKENIFYVEPQMLELPEGETGEKSIFGHFQTTVSVLTIF